MIEKRNNNNNKQKHQKKKQIKILIISTLTKNNSCRKICEYLSLSEVTLKAVCAKKSNLTVKAQYQQEKKDKDRKKRERKQNSELLETGFVKARTDFKIKKIK